jgi:hypothetical protein
MIPGQLLTQTDKSRVNAWFASSDMKQPFPARGLKSFHPLGGCPMEDYLGAQITGCDAAVIATEIASRQQDPIRFHFISQVHILFLSAESAGLSGAPE